MNTNRYPHLTLVKPSRAHARHARPAPLAIARHREFDRFGGAHRDGLCDVATREDLLNRLDTVGDLAPLAPLSFVAVKVVGLRELNRERGHSKGDEVLRIVADTVVRWTRATDMVGRISGNEFGVVLQGTAAAGADAVAARLGFHLAQALAAYPMVRCEAAAATGTGANATLLATVALDPLEHLA